MKLVSTKLRIWDTPLMRISNTMRDIPFDEKNKIIDNTYGQSLNGTSVRLRVYHPDTSGMFDHVPRRQVVVDSLIKAAEAEENTEEPTMPTLHTKYKIKGQIRHEKDGMVWYETPKTE